MDCTLCKVQYVVKSETAFNITLKKYGENVTILLFYFFIIVFLINKKWVKFFKLRYFNTYECL